MRILLTGAKGQLGCCFQDRMPSDWTVLALDHDGLDIGDRAAVMQAVEQFEPTVIVNAAAYTAVDKAEDDAERALLINAKGPEYLSEAALRLGARLFHISTDYVFDGTATEAYKEDDKTNPIGVYGRTKRVGEEAVLLMDPRAVIIRTSWVFSEYGNNFVKTMLRLGAEREILGIVSDQRGCPTYAGDLAAAIIALLDVPSARGIYHFCGDRPVTWFEFAQSIFGYAVEKESYLGRPQVNAISTDAYPTRAKRPAYSVLNCERLAGLIDVSSSWDKGLQKVIDVLTTKDF